MKHKLIIISMLLFSSTSILFASNSITLNVRPVKPGKPAPTVDTVITASYDDGTVMIRSKEEIPFIEVNIQSSSGDVIYSHCISSPAQSATRIDLPEEVDEDKYAIELRYNGNVLYGNF